MHRDYKRTLNWIALALIAIVAVAYVAMAVAGDVAPWNRWALVALLLFNVIVLGLARGRFSPATLTILASLSAAGGLILLVSLASAWSFS